MTFFLYLLWFSKGSLELWSLAFVLAEVEVETVFPQETLYMRVVHDGCYA